MEDVHLPFCTWLIKNPFLVGVELLHFFHPKCVGGVWFV